MKKVIRLTEGDLHRIVKESVKKVLKESYESQLEKKWRAQWREAYDAGRTSMGFYQYLEYMSPQAYQTITGERPSEESIQSYEKAGKDPGRMYGPADNWRPDSAYFAGMR